MKLRLGLWLGIGVGGTEVVDGCRDGESATEVWVERGQMGRGLRGGPRERLERVDGLERVAGRAERTGGRGRARCYGGSGNGGGGGGGCEGGFVGG